MLYIKTSGKFMNKKDLWQYYGSNCGGLMIQITTITKKRMQLIGNNEFLNLKVIEHYICLTNSAPFLSLFFTYPYLILCVTAPFAESLGTIDFILLSLLSYTVRKL